MNHSRSSEVARWVTRFVPVAMFAALLSLATLASAQNITHVEEDWELVLGQPDQNVCGPQVATTMSPFNNISDTFFTFEINHRSPPIGRPAG